MARIYTRFLTGISTTTTIGPSRRFELLRVPETALYTVVLRSIVVVGRDSALNAGNVFVGGIYGESYGAIEASVLSFAWTAATALTGRFPYWTWNGHMPVPAYGTVNIYFTEGYGTCIIGGWVLTWPTPTPLKNAPWPASFPHP